MINVWENNINNDALRSIQSCISERCIMEGKYLSEFEDRIRNILGVRYVIGVASGTAALTLGLMGAGISHGDEVIVPDITFIATANAAHMVGAKVVAVPVEKNRPIIDINKLENYVNKKTKAIITVDLNGRYSWSRELRERYGKDGIWIINDACQAFLSNDRKSGTEADIGCFSFGITKTVTTLNGGAVVTNNQELYEKMKIMKTQGMKSVYEGDKYYYPGFNFKLMDVLASVGINQLDLIPEKMRHMNTVDRMYREGLEEIDGISFFEKPNGEFSWMVDIMCENRDAIRRILEEEGIMSRPMACPIHYASYIECRGDYSTSDNFRSKGLFLPCGPNQAFDNVEKTINTILKHKNIIRK